jgi:hypothetical protein
MFWEKNTDNLDVNGSDYMIVTTDVWRFLWFVWSKKTIKSFHKLKYEDKFKLNLNL